MILNTIFQASKLLGHQLLKNSRFYSRKTKTVALSSLTMSASPNPFLGQFAAAEVGIFYDVEDCKIPDDSECNADVVLRKIKENLTSSNHRGSVSIFVYGDMTKDHKFPSNEGIKLNHFPPGGARHVRHSKVLADIVAWAEKHPEPSTTDVSDDFTKVVELLTTGKGYQFLFLYQNP